MIVPDEVIAKDNPIVRAPNGLIAVFLLSRRARARFFIVQKNVTCLPPSRSCLRIAPPDRRIAPFVSDHPCPAIVLLWSGRTLWQPGSDLCLKVRCFFRGLTRSATGLSPARLAGKFARGAMTDHRRPRHRACARRREHGQSIAGKPG